MAQYYYFVASLPGLAFSAPPPVTQAWYAEECARNLAPADYEEYRVLVEERLDDVRTDFSLRYLSAECQIRNAVARSRALSRGIDEKPYIRPHSFFRVYAESAVNDAFSRANPLERELALDRYRWNLADELSLEGAFGLPAVLAYAVKLRIAERWKKLSPEAGREKLETLLGMVGVAPEDDSGWSGLARM